MTVLVLSCAQKDCRCLEQSWLQYSKQYFLISFLLQQSPRGRCCRLY